MPPNSAAQIFYFFVFAGILFFLLPGWFRLQIRGESSGKYEARLSLQLAFGIVGVLLSRSDSQQKAGICFCGLFINLLPFWQKKLGKKESPAKEKAHSEKTGVQKRWAKFFWQERKKLIHYCKRLKKWVMVDYFKGDFIFGFTNPAATGEVFGMISVIQSQFPRKIDMKIQPQFLSSCFSGNLAGRVVFFPFFWLIIIFWGFCDFAWQYAKACRLFTARSMP